MKKFNSLLGPDMESFLELKESLGYSRNTYQYQLGKIDEYAITNHPQLDVMNEAMVLGWASKRKGESNNGRRTRLFTIREFGKYQRGIGKHTYVLTTDYFDKPLNYIPYLFSDEELKLLFMAIDSLPANGRSPEIELVLPVLFRMMYCCALRPTEPLKLLREDVDLANGTIFIRDSKRHKDRIVRMTDDLCRLCIKYDSFKKARTYFFTAPDGRSYKWGWMAYQFKICWEKTEPYKGQRKPRPYDLRHSSCSRVILKWLEDSKDFYELAPFLREHMGHGDFAHTFVYIHLLPENIVKNAGIDWSRFDFMYPEVCDEEA